MKNLLFLATFLTISSAMSQPTSDDQPLNTLFGVKVGLPDIVVMTEPGINQSFSLLLAGGFNAGYSSTYGLILTPALTLEPRYYFSRQWRIDANKSVLNNMGGYLSFENKFLLHNLDITSEETGGGPAWGVSPKIGYRHGLGRSIFFEASAGYGAVLEHGYFSWSPAVGLHFGVFF